MVLVRRGFATCRLGDTVLLLVVMLVFYYLSHGFSPCVVQQGQLVSKGRRSPWLWQAHLMGMTALCWPVLGASIAFFCLQTLLSESLVFLMLSRRAKLPACHTRHRGQAWPPVLVPGQHQ